MWVARDKDNNLSLFEEFPFRYTDGNELLNHIWLSDYPYIRLDNALFPNLKWEDAPIEVSLIPVISPELKESIAEKIIKEYGRTNHSTDNQIMLITNKIFNELINMSYVGSKR